MVVDAEQTYSPVGPDEDALLRAFGTHPGALLGSGGEARVFALPDDATVLRLYAPTPEPHPLPLRPLLDSWVGVDLGFALPRILEVGRRGSQSWTIESRLPGIPLDRWLADTPDADARHRALVGFLDAAARLQELPLPTPGFGRPWAPEERFDSLVDLLAAQVDVGLGLGGDALCERVPGLDARVAELLARLAQRETTPRFVHGDLAPANVLVDTSGAVTAVLDFSVHALAADPVLDLVGAVAFVELTPYPGRYADAARLQPVLADRLGADAWLIDAYRRFWALYYAMDPGLHPWCAAQFSTAPDLTRQQLTRTTRTDTSRLSGD